MTAGKINRSLAKFAETLDGLRLISICGQGNFADVM
jgi:hypothetical protein